MPPVGNLLACVLLAMLPLLPASLTLAAAIGPSSPPTCAGDCNGDGVVSVDELLTTAAIALGDAGVDACAAGDSNRDGRVDLADVVTAVDNGVSGCPPAPTPTSTPMPTARADDCCQCLTQCMPPSQGSCGQCDLVHNATCLELLCVLFTMTPTPTPTDSPTSTATATATSSATMTPTVTDSPTATDTPTTTATSAPSATPTDTPTDTGLQ